MPLTAPPSAPTAPGDAPSRSNPITFRVLADSFVTWQVGFRTWLAGFASWASTHVAEMQALQDDVTVKQIVAANAASSAATSSGWAFTYMGEAQAAVAGSAGAQFASYAALRAYTGAVKSAYVTGYLVSSAPSPISGLFTVDDSDTTSTDNGGTIIVASNGKRWKRIHNGILRPGWFGAVGDGVADDTTALQSVVAAAVSIVGCVDLGSGKYRITSPIASMITVPIAIYGDSPASCWIVVDSTMSGDVLSFRNTWYGADQVLATGGTTGPGGSDGRKWASTTGRKAGVRLEGFMITGDRNAAAVQNGIVFYDRNDGVKMRDVEVEFLRGHGIVFSGLPSNIASNAATCMRESECIDWQVRWCGDWASGRASVLFTSSSKTAAQAGGLGNVADDANNYNILRGKIIFPEGVGFQSNDYNENSTHQSNNQVELIVDSQHGPAGNLNYISGGSIDSAHWSCTNGVLTITAGGAFTKVTGVGVGDLTVGSYVFHASIPPGTYISAINSGPGADGAGVYQLANRNVSLASLTIASGSGSCRFTNPMVEIGGGHTGDDYQVTCNGSPIQGSNSTGIVFSQNPLHANTPKTSLSRLEFSCGSIDQGLMFVMVSSLDVRMTIRTPSVGVYAGNITQCVAVDVGSVGAGLSGEVAINGSRQNLHIYPGGQKVVYGATIGAVMTDDKWPNCEMYLNNAGTITRWLSVPQSGTGYGTCTWTAV